MAVRAPALTISPYWATEPLMGPAMAILTVSAWARLAAVRPAVAITAAMAVDVRRDNVIRSSSIMFGSFRAEAA
ncbi:hypothetical protein D3C72_1966000 [compost metagenome]